MVVASESAKRSSKIWIGGGALVLALTVIIGLSLTGKRTPEATSPVNRTVTEKEAGQPASVDPAAMVHAVTLGDLDAVIQKIADGMSLQMVDAGGWTYLHLAAANGHADIVKWLLEQGLSADARDSLGQTPLHLALVSGHESVATILASRTSTVDSLQQLRVAIRADDLTAVERVLTAGVDLTKHDDTTGRSAVHLAAWHRRVEILQRLLPHVKDVDSRDAQKRTALHLAALSGTAECARLLLAAGADTNTVDGDGYAPIHLAALAGHAEVVAILLTGKANPQLPSPKGTAAELAAERGQLDILDLLASR